MNSQPAPPPPDPCVVLCGQSPVTSLAFAPVEYGQMCVSLFSGHQNGKIIQWNLTSQRPVVSWQGHADSVLWLSRTEDKLLSQGRDGVVRIWISLQPPGMTNIGEIASAALIFCNSAICNRNGDYYLAVPSEKTAEVNVYHLNLRDSHLPSGDSLATTVPLTTPSPSSDSVEPSPKPHSMSTFSHSLKPTTVKQYAMCMKMCSFSTSEDKARLLVAYESGFLLLWDLLKGVLLHEIKAHEESIMCMDVWSDSQANIAKSVTGSVDTTIKSWHITDDKISLRTAVSATNPGFSDLAIRRDGKIFASGGWDSMGRVFSLGKLRPLAVLTYHRGSIQSVTFAPDKTLVTGSKDGYIALWKLYMDK